ncbi:MAG: hypothetical protein U0359_27005 [Byssovorax sp.]
MPRPADDPPTQKSHRAKGLFLTAALCLVGLGDLGCARTVDLRAETAVSDGGAGFWVAGTEGFAAYSAGDGTLLRRDYPRAPGAPDYAYEPAMLPAAHLLLAGGKGGMLFLFTRAGDVLRWQAGSFVKVNVKLETGEPWPPQIDAALESPTGQIAIQIHSDTLLWTTTADLLRGLILRREKTRGYMTWLGFVDGTLYGIGWDGTGNRRAVHRYDGPSQWTMVGLLPATEGLNGPGAIVRAPGGRLAVVASTGLYLEGKDGFSDLSPVESLVLKPAQVAGPAEAEADRQTPIEDPVRRTPAPSLDQAPPGAPAERQAPPSIVQPRPDPKIAVDAPAPPPPPSISHGAYVIRVLEMQDRPPLLVVSGGTPGLVALGPGRPRFVPCEAAYSLAAAITGPDRVWLVGSDAALYELGERGCPKRGRALLGEAGAPGSPPSAP